MRKQLNYRLFYFVLFIFFAQSDTTLNINLEVDSTQNINLVDTLYSNHVSSLKIDSLLNGSQSNDIFYEQLYESKLTFSDAIIYDIPLDTIEAQIHFQSLFELSEFDFLFLWKVNY